MGPAAAGVSLGSMQIKSGATVATMIVFTLVAGVTVVAPVTAFLIAGHRIDDKLETAKDWLITNNAAVMAVLLVVFGANLIGDAIGILTG